MMSDMKKLAIAVLLLASGFAPGQAGDSAETIYNRGLNAFLGPGTTYPTQGLADIRRAAEMGYVPAETALGTVYQKGIAVTSNVAEATRWYRKAAESGDSLGEYLLGRTYFVGPPKDDNEAMKWLGKAADQGNAFAQYLLGRVLESRGEYAKAADAYRDAAEQGLPQAEFHLGLLLKDGQGGVPQDKVEAYVWLQLAALASPGTAQMPLSLLEGALSPSEVEAAKTKAREREGKVRRALHSHGCEGWDGESNELPTVPPLETQKYCR
jgi:TPR repeat protein